MSDINAESIKVFISYSHDSPEHMERVLRLSDRLRRDGIDCIIDQYETSPRQGWPLWTLIQTEEARFVLVVCTEIYHRRVRGKGEPGKGLGAKWEGAIITQELHDSEANNDKFIPLQFSSEGSAHIPVYLRGAERYVLDDDYEDLYRHITNQPKYLKPALGARRSMPPLDRKEDFLPIPESRNFGSVAGIGRTTPDADQSLKTSPTDQPSKPVSEQKPDKPTEVRSRVRPGWMFGALAGFAALALTLVLWFSLFAPVKPGPDLHKTPDPNPIAIYRVRVTVLNPQQVPINDVAIISSVGGEQKNVDSGCQIDIPAASLPVDGKITVYASNPAFSLYGQQDLVLDKDPNPTLKIQLRVGEPPIREGASLNPQNPVGGGSPAKPTPSPPNGIYRVRVTVLDLEQALVEEAEIHSLPSGEVKKVSGGWEVDIPAANKPVDGKLTIYASKPSAFLKEQVVLQLGKDLNPTVEIHLRKEPSAHVSGWVKDSSGQGIAGALAYVCEQRAEAVRTGPDGKFDLLAHKARGQIVTMCAEKEGYITERQNHPAGTIPMTITLPRGQQ